MVSFLTKFVVVTGGVLSGLGKGILTASIGNLICEDKKCATIKCDGYLNIDPGTMNPTEHGEVFVLEDGAECDMDFGHYERFVGVIAKKDWSLTMGKIFESVLEKERRGNFLGKTVQFVPHVTNEIKEKIFSVEKEENADFVLIEIGGTIGDLENSLYLEAMRQLVWERGKENVLFVHLSYVPIPVGVNEQKSKPTQMSVKRLNEIGIQPDVIVCRCSEYLSDNIKKKIALFCNLHEENILTGKDVNNVYLIPHELRMQGLEKIIEKKLGTKILKKNSEKWDSLALKMGNGFDKKIVIGICGKYCSLKDSYASIVEALKHSSANLEIGLEVKMVDSENMSEKELSCLDGVIVPGGFGKRGWEEKIGVVRYARENNIPLLGICLGMHAVVVEFARNVCGLEADSVEMDPNAKEKIITLLDEQKNVVNKGETMRLGAYESLVKKDSLLEKIYSSTKISERHRHRYEVNPEYNNILEEKGLMISGKCSDNNLAEFVELSEKDHCFFIATQSHPELKSKLEKPAPLFTSFLEAVLKK